MRPILLGMNNPLSGKPEHALFPYPPGCTGHRVLRLLQRRRPEVTRYEYLKAFDRRNLIDARMWKQQEARVRAAEFIESIRNTDVTVLVFGDKPRAALGLPKLLLHPHEMEGVTWRQLPHPSGRCLWYNDETCALLAAELLSSLYDIGARYVSDKEKHL